MVYLIAVITILAVAGMLAIGVRERLWAKGRKQK